MTSGTVKRIDGTREHGSISSGIIVNKEGEGSFLIIWDDGSMSMEKVDDIVLELKDPPEWGDVISMPKKPTLQ